MYPPIINLVPENAFQVITTIIVMSIDYTIFVKLSTII
jgi:hypothetical protein